jgi:plasmid maintenance system killer protein
MILSFADELTEMLFHGIYTHAVRKAFSSSQVKAIEHKLDLLNSVETLETLQTIPSLQTEVVRDAHGKYSIPITTEWRLAFDWNGNPQAVEIKSN